MKLDPISLRLFVAVMEENAIARAAAREHIAPSAASRRLAELEAQLQVELFTRSNRGSSPTAAAFALLNMARGVLNEMDGIALQMKDYAQDGGKGLRGHVRVMANISSITQFLPAQLQSFLSQYPLVDVRLQERVSTDIARAVEDNEADIGLLNNGSYGSKIRLRPYRRDRLTVVVPLAHALARKRRLRLAQVIEHDLIGMHADSALNHLITRAAADQGLQPRLRMKVTGYDALCLMVASGLGIGILPEGSARLYTGTLPLRCIVLDEPWAERQLMLCLRSQDALSPVAQLLVEHLCLPQDAPTL
ncbi:LysR family transcriptional regulator [Comamonas sp. lk]|uniref:LysR family transcriptional regulator n=1 Tax=Comamonas sp. lk TaxID=2201272 RepID=UPI000EB4916B|nr:LysR family transcriptional regulator [Comamonas sp. lk]